MYEDGRCHASHTLLICQLSQSVIPSTGGKMVMFETKTTLESSELPLFWVHLPKLSEILECHSGDRQLRQTGRVWEGHASLNRWRDHPMWIHPYFINMMQIFSWSHHIIRRRSPGLFSGLRNFFFYFFLFNMKYIMKFYRPLYVSIKITMMPHRLVDCQNKHKYSTSMFGDLH